MYISLYDKYFSGGRGMLNWPPPPPQRPFFGQKTRDASAQNCQKSGKFGIRERAGAFSIDFLDFKYTHTHSRKSTTKNITPQFFGSRIFGMNVFWGISIVFNHLPVKKRTLSLKHYIVSVKFFVLIFFFYICQWIPFWCFTAFIDI